MVIIIVDNYAVDMRNHIETMDNFGKKDVLKEEILRNLKHIIRTASLSQKQKNDYSMVVIFFIMKMEY